MKTLVQLFAVLVLGGILVSGQQTAPAPTTIVPRLVKFSGRAVDDNGKTLSGIAGLTFAIYREQQGGVPLWMETQNVQADAKGNFTAQLGATKSEGLPLDLFASGEARWLGVRVNGGGEQPRVVLLSVPYALKADDAQTLNGLPASAFMLAAPVAGGATGLPANGTASTSSVTVLPPASSNVTTTGGAVNALPLWTTGTNIQNSIVTQTGTTAVNVSGKLNLPATGTATATKAFNSDPQALVASVFNKTTGTAVAQTFQLQAEPANNNTATASGTLNLLYGTGTVPPAETGLKISNKGVFTFAPGQAFPGAGTVTSVGLTAPASDFNVTGSPVTKSGSLGLSWTVTPTPNPTQNAIVKRDGAGAFIATSVTGTGSASNAIIGTIAGGTLVFTGGADGVYGASNDPSGHGVFGADPSNAGVAGSGLDGVRALGTNHGVFATSTGAGSVGVSGTSNGTNGTGVYGIAGTYGVYGTAAGSGVYGLTSAATGFGVTGVNSAAGGVGVSGVGLGYGVTGSSNTGTGSGVGAFNTSTGDALFASNQSGGLAGYFFGDVTVNGNLSKGGGSFQIDHPIDPANKFLFHSFVESPDMMNIYNGNVTTDAHGDAVVTMPDWFEALNRDFRYQLTVIGQFAQAIVAHKMNGNRFSIKTDKPNVEVSWQVTGVRHDAWADAHRIPVEQAKPEGQRGFYLHPELFGAPAEKSIALARHPEAAKILKEAKTRTVGVEQPDKR